MRDQPDLGDRSGDAILPDGPRVKLGVLLRLGRVSNLPTVWTNVLAGASLAGANPHIGVLLVVCCAASLFYVGGMYLNDGFDSEIDARERPERPIPSGQIGISAVFRAGFGMLAGGLLVIGVLALATGTGVMPVFAATLLCGVIVGYNADHKGNPLSPLLMGFCRVLVYVLAALATDGELAPPLIFGCAAALSYLMGLTYVAKQENLLEFNGVWPLALLAVPFIHFAALGTLSGIVLYVLLAAWIAYTLSFVLRPLVRDVSRAVAQFIAGIALLDAMFVAGEGHPLMAGLCVVGFGATLLLQRRVPGT